MPQSTIFQLGWDSSQRNGDRKEELDKIKRYQPHLNVPSVKQISSCRNATYGNPISLKAAGCF